MIRLLLVPVCAVLFLIFAVAHVAYADTLDEQTRHIGKQLQCPVCSGAPVSDSPSELAGQMRAVIRTKLQAGETEPQIIAYFVERYGDAVLVEPPRRGFTLVAWLAPVAMLLVGSIVLWRLLAGWLRPRWSGASAAGMTPATAPLAAYRNGTGAPHANEPDAPSSVDRARAELDRFRREG
jgi:cytochrome c-type biogenesis protein CcmH